MRILRLLISLAALAASLARDASLRMGILVSWPFRFAARIFDRVARFFEYRM